MSDRLLVLVRHGQSEWNLKNLFTAGRIPISPRKASPRPSMPAASLKAQGLTFDIAIHVGAFARAAHAGSDADRTGADGLPAKKHLALNERDYGDLSGLNKDDAARNGAKSRCMSGGVPMMCRRRRRSLKDTLARTLPYYVQEILPCVLRGERTLVAAHGNSLRALIMVLEKLSPEGILARELATGVPIIYRLKCGCYGCIEARSRGVIRRNVQPCRPQCFGDAAKRWLHPSRRRFAPPQDEVILSLMVRSAATPRVSNHAIAEASELPPARLPSPASPACG